MAGSAGKGSLMGLQSSGYQLISARLLHYERLLSSCKLTPQEVDALIKPARDALENRLGGFIPYPKYDFAFAHLFEIRNFFCQQLPLPDLVGTILPEIRDDLDYPGVTADQSSEIKPVGDALLAAIQAQAQTPGQPHDITFERTKLQVLSQTAAQARGAHWLKVNMSRNRLLIMGVTAFLLLVIAIWWSAKLPPVPKAQGTAGEASTTPSPSPSSIASPSASETVSPSPTAGQEGSGASDNTAKPKGSDNASKDVQPTQSGRTCNPLVWLVALLGILGGLTSALMDTESVYTRVSEYYLNRRLLYVRPVIGGIVALVVCDAIWGGFLTVAGVHPYSSSQAFLVIAFIAGFAERAFVSNLLSLANVNDGSIVQPRHTAPTVPSPGAPLGPAGGAAAGGTPAAGASAPVGGGADPAAATPWPPAGGAAAEAAAPSSASEEGKPATAR